MRSFYERLLFPYLTYDNNYSSLAPKKMLTACIYTMNIKEKEITTRNYHSFLDMVEGFIESVFTKPDHVYSCNTYQFSDYSKYKCECFDEKDKKKQLEEQFPIDCENAFNLGVNLAKKLIIK